MSNNRSYTALHSTSGVPGHGRWTGPEARNSRTWKYIGQQTPAVPSPSARVSTVDVVVVGDVVALGRCPVCSDPCTTYLLVKVLLQDGHVLRYIRCIGPYSCESTYQNHVRKCVYIFVLLQISASDYISTIFFIIAYYRFRNNV